MKRVVVTGGAGFIGSHLAETLADSYQVSILDDLSTGSLVNVRYLLGKPQVHFIQGSILDLVLLRKTFEGADYVFHLAALARVPQSIENPTIANRINIEGTLNVLIAARESGVRKVIFSSSSAVYGESQTLPQREDSRLIPMSPYALTKLAGEHYCDLFTRLYGLPTVSLRYFNAYGTRQDPGSSYANVIPLFIGRAARNLAPVIYDDGEQTRDFVFVGDVARANILAAESDAQGIYNIGSGQGTAINRLTRMILDLMGRDLVPEHREARPGDPRHTLADISSARSFGYEPRWSLEEGLKSVVAAYSSLSP